MCNKNMILIALMTLATSTINAHYFNNFFFPKEEILSGVIQYPKNIENPPVLNIFFKGREVQVEVDTSSRKPKRACFELYENKHATTLYILITAEIARPKKNTIKYLETSPDHPYRLFSLTRKSKPDTEQQEQSLEYFEIDELDNNQKIISIPDNTIIFFMNPSFIETLEEQCWALHDTIIKLPKIIFKDSVYEKDIHDVALLVSCGIMIDLKCIHKKETKTSVRGNGYILTMRNPINRYTASL